MKEKSELFCKQRKMDWTASCFWAVPLPLAAELLRGSKPSCSASQDCGPLFGPCLGDGCFAAQGRCHYCALMALLQDLHGKPRATDVRPADPVQWPTVAV